MATMERLGVIGGGVMGSGISEVGARSGLDVITVEVDDDTAKAARDRVEASLHHAQERGKLDAAAVEEALGRITFTSDLDALADRQLVVEAATEDEATKLDLFSRVGTILDADDAILASNTSPSRSSSSAPCPAGPSS